MAKQPKKAWATKTQQRESAVAVSLPYLHEDAESVRLRAVISGNYDSWRMSLIDVPDRPTEEEFASLPVLDMKEFDDQ